MTDLTRDQERGLVLAGWLTPEAAKRQAEGVIGLVERLTEQHDLLVDARRLLLNAMNAPDVFDDQRREAAVVVESIEELLGLEVEQ